MIEREVHGMQGEAAGRFVAAAVHGVAADDMAERLELGADLVLAARMRAHPRQRVTAADQGRLEERRRRRGADLLELANVVVGTLRRGLHGPRLRNAILPHVQEPGAGRRQQPLVQAGPVVVHLEVAELVREMRGRMRAIDDRGDAARTRHARDVLHREDLPRQVGDVAEVDELRLRCDGLREHVVEIIHGGGGHREGEFVEFDAVAADALPKNFSTPHGITGSNDGKIYVADRRGNRIQVERELARRRWSAVIQGFRTRDAAFRIFLDVLDPNLIETQGTDIGRAIETSLKAFDVRDRKHRVLLLLTDGEDHSGEAERAAEEAAKEGVMVYTVGIGLPSGVPIPVDNGNGQVSYKKDADGNIVTSRMDPDLLERIAQKTGGKFYHAEPGHYELLDVLKEINGMEKREFDEDKFTRFEDRYQIPLAIGLALLVAEMLISDRRRRKREWTGRFS